MLGPFFERKYWGETLREEDRAKISRLFSIGRAIRPSKQTRNALPPQEREHRVQMYAALIDDVLKGEQARRSPECWACGKMCPKRNHITSIGWATRPIQLVGVAMSTYREVYCPECFQRWGWPDPVTTQSISQEEQRC